MSLVECLNRYSHAVGKAETEPHRTIRIAETGVNRRKGENGPQSARREKRKEKRERRWRQIDGLLIC